MPLLVLPDGTALPESEVITQYLLDKHSSGENAAALQSQDVPHSI